MRGMIRANRRCVELGRSPEQSESIPLSPVTEATSAMRSARFFRRFAIQNTLGQMARAHRDFAYGIPKT